MTSGARAETIVAGLEDAGARSGDRGLVFHLAEGARVIRWADLPDLARRGAAALAAWGVQPGDTVGILGPNRPEWVQWAFAAWARGAVVVPVQFEMRVSDPEGHAMRIGSLVEAAGCRVVLADPKFLPSLPPGVGRAWDEPLPARAGSAPVDPGPSDPAVLQFTSGSTATPKAAELSHGAVMAASWAHIDAWTRPGAGEVVLAWLPLFHDNGLFGHLVSPAADGLSCHIIPTERFARNPALWFRTLTEVGGTLTSGPCSAWSVALRAALRRPAGIDLGRLRVGVLGAEAIDPDVVDRFEEQGAQIGLRPGTLIGGYGLAEATLTVTAGAPEGGIAMDEIDLEAFAHRAVAEPAGPGVPAKRVASCGRPLPRVSVRIGGPDGPLPDRRIGEIQVMTRALMNGYRGLAQQPFGEDGWLHTGDLGYTVDGELFVTGRSKDVIIVFGRNYAPEDFEWVAARVPGVRPGHCVAFSDPTGRGGEGSVVVVVEPAGSESPDEVAARVAKSVAESLGVAVGRVLVAARGSITRTTSGKLQRAALRAAYARGEVAPAADPGSAPAEAAEAAGAHDAAGG